MAIDPPYRFDPWQNLVNVHFGSGTFEALYQYFVFERSLEQPNVNRYYPVDESFYLAMLASGEGAEAYASSIVEDGSLKRTIEVAMDRTLWEDYAPQIYANWLSNSAYLSGVAYDQPARNLRPLHDYYFMVIPYAIDDMNTGDWPPPFEPLP